MASFAHRAALLCGCAAILAAICYQRRRLSRPPRPAQPSKGALRRAAAREVYLEKRRARKLAQRQKRREAPHELRPRSSREQPASSRLPSAAAVHANVAIDFGFDELMSDREIRSLAQQLLFCHASLKREGHRSGVPPLSWHWTSFGGRLAAQCARIQGSDRWEVARDARSCFEAFAEQSERLVYLSSEATEPLDTLDADAIYVIGGLVDRNRHKNICHARATAAGIRTARLPLGEHVQLASRQVLAVNHVFELLLRVAQGEGWPEAIMAVLPPRKGAVLRESEIENPVLCKQVFSPGRSWWRARRRERGIHLFYSPPVRRIPGGVHKTQHD